MSRHTRLLAGLLLTAACFVTIAGVWAQGRRQYYGQWAPSGKGYYYCHYYFKPDPRDADYNHHYCIYYPGTPQYVYFYNPESKVYWGRYDCHRRGYSMLPQQARNATLKAIPEKSFPAPAPLPPIPESKDKTPIAPPPEPPADLPQG